MPNTGSNIERAKQKVIAFIKDHTSGMSTAAYTILLQAIEDTFDLQEGKIQGGKGFIKQLNKLTIDFVDLLQTTPKFTGPVSQFVKRMPLISDEISIFQKSVNGIIVPAFETQKKIIIDEVIDKMLNNGLNQKFVIPLRDLIYQNVTGGLSLKDAKSQIREFINGGKDESGKLGSYLEQTAIQATSVYSGMINLKILETFDMDGLLITGSLIDNSSPQCRYAIEKLNELITRENWHEVEAIGKKQSGWIEGTNFDNVPLNLLHHGCRHSFYPKIVKELKKAA